VNLEILAVQGIGEVTDGADLVSLIAAHAPPLLDGDVLVVTSKIVSKSEGRVVDLDRSAAIAGETVRVVATRGDTQIVQTRHGFVMAAAGVDASNVEKGRVVLLPLDADASAERLRQGFLDRFGLAIGVVISDTFGRPWRVGVTDVAVGVAGFAALEDFRGSTDSYGNDLQMTVTCVADEIASAGELVKGKLSGIPVAVVRGLSVVRPGASTGIREIVRGADDDMFSLGSRDVLPARVDATSFGSAPVPPAALRRALTAAGLASVPGPPITLEFLVPHGVPAFIGELYGPLAASAPIIVVPWLRHPSLWSGGPIPPEFMAAGAAIENVLVALAVEQLASRWMLAAHHVDAVTYGLGADAWPIGIIAVGSPA
jgi:coenzyme F420-0:L-glutamate ligase/coenzyme F420-1:gamma-L-glutamate ligase